MYKKGSDKIFEWIWPGTQIEEHVSQKGLGNNVYGPEMQCDVQAEAGGGFQQSKTLPSSHWRPHDSCCHLLCLQAGMARAFHGTLDKRLT